jgi:hypothetical protein
MIMRVREKRKDRYRGQLRERKIRERELERMDETEMENNEIKMGSL